MDTAWTHTHRCLWIVVTTISTVLCILTTSAIVLPESNDALFSSPVTRSGDPACLCDGCEEKIEEIIGHRLLAGASVGMQVVSLEDGEPVYGRNADRLFIPASCMKILSGGVALELLGGEYRFVTEVIADSMPVDGVIEGNLYVVGSGDPFLVSERLWMLAREIHHRGISLVRGDLVADVHFFDDETYPASWGGQDSQAYHAMISPFSVNFNTFAFHVYPGSHSAGKPRIIPDFDIDNYALNNSATTASGESNSFWIDRIDGERDGSLAQRFFASGNIRPDRSPFTVYRSVSNVPYHGLVVLKEIMQQVGIQCEGKLRTGAAPATSVMITAFESKPFSLIVRDLLKYSNNFIAEQVLKTLGAIREGEPGTREKGLRAVQKHLEILGLWQKDFHFDDASGLSRENRISPFLLVAYLRHISGSCAVFPEFESALALGGIDGTLKTRCSNSSATGRVRAKTGNLTGISTVSGYLYPLRGGKLVFSLMMNGISPKANIEEIWRLQDRMLEVFITGYDRTGVSKGTTVPIGTSG
jgi:D-alanyl-D-alanine carboxypeptidase/D-alanyl-D-alanine-endopeptidase (penicillin-binding protein 4)